MKTQYGLNTTILLIAGICAPCFADMPPKPEACPQVQAIKSVGFSLSPHNDKGYYVVGQFDQYNTKETWLFAIPNIQATSDSDALSIAYKALDTLSSVSTPLAVESKNVWACMYQTNIGTAVAITPINLSTTINSAIQSEQK